MPLSTVAADVYRDFALDGVPASGPHKPKKPDIRRLLSGYEQVINAFTSSGGIIAQGLAGLNANLNYPSLTMAWVLNDATAGNNGIYQKQGASGAGSWVRVADLPYSFIVASDEGAGTTNAIEATSALPISGSALVLLNIFETNGPGPVTVRFNGAGPVYTIKTASGNDPAAGGFLPGMQVVGRVSGETFRLYSDQASAAVLAAAEAKALEAEGHADDAEAAALVATGAMSTVLDPLFASRAVASAWTPVVAADYIRTAGYALAGDGGGALYKKVVSEPVHAGKFSITLADGVTVVWFEIAEKVLTPLMFGAVGDGVSTDDGAFVTWAAVLAARPAPRFGNIPAGTYKLNSANIVIPASTTVVGQGCVIDISGAATGAWAFLVQGTEGIKYPLTVDATGSSTSGMSAANVVASGIVAGDWVRLTSDAVFDSLRTNSKVGEMAKIRSANSGTGLLTFGTPGSVTRLLADSYLVSQAATISKLNVIADVHFIGRGKIISNNNFGVSQHKGILFDKTVRCSVDGWSGAKIDDVFLRVNDSTDFNGKSIHGENFNSSGTGYLVSVSGCSQDCYFEGLTGRLIRHLFATNNPTSSPGIPRRIIVNGFFSEESATASGGSGGDAMDTHAASEDIHFANGIIHNPSNCGVVMEGRGGSLHNIKVYNPVVDGFLLNNWSDRSAEYSISDLQVFGAGRDGLRITPAAGAGRVRCVSGGNIVAHRSVGVGFYINGTETQPIDKISLSNIQVLGYGSSAGGIYFNEVKGGSVNGLLTEFSSSTPAASNGTRLRNCENLSVSAINAALPSASTGNALLIEEGGTGVCRRITVDDVIATGAAPSSSTGVRIANNVDEVTLGPRRRFNSVTTPVSWGTGTGHLKSDAVAAP